MPKNLQQSHFRLHLQESCLEFTAISATFRWCAVCIRLPFWRH